MFRLAEALAACATANGAAFLYNTKVTEIQSANGRTAGVRLDHGETLAADAVIANADLAALDAGYFGAAAKAAVAGMLKGAAPSLSAVTWVCTGTASGFPLAHHNVFFANNYPAEFVAISNGRLPPDPTVYLCAPEPGRFFCLINAPAGADTSLAPAGADKNREEDECLSHVLKKLQRCGLKLRPEAITRTGPQEFGRLFPASRGALYGRALEGWRDSFARPGARTKLPGLYLVGGAIHPGPGLPMAALSGRLAAARLLDQYGFGSNRHIRSKPMKLIASTKS
jgi:1-hydroxycarotenoid 3,4-desaturase